MISRLVALALTLSVLGAPSTGRGAMSVGNYLLIETKQVEVDPDYAYVYVSGVLDALTAFNEAVRATGVSLFCPTDDQDVIAIDVFKTLIDRAIVRAQEERPDFEEFARSASLGIIGLGVLNETFPCADG
jgi:hypothetical protein